MDSHRCHGIPYTADRAPTYPNSTSPHGVEGKTKVGQRCWEREPERQRDIEDIKRRAREREREK